MVLIVKNVKRELQLMERHMRIMRLLSEQGPLGILKLSKITEIPPQQVRYSLRIIQQCSFLQPTTKGAELSAAGYKFLKDFAIEKRKLAEKISRI